MICKGITKLTAGKKAIEAEVRTAVIQSMEDSARCRLST